MDKSQQEPAGASDVQSTEDIDEQRRQFLLKSTAALGGVGAACALTPFVASWLPSAKAQAAGAPVQVDLSTLEPGQQATVEWQGKPVWIIRRTKAMLNTLKNVEDQLRDPKSVVDQQPSYVNPQHRAINPEYLVLIGVCTHLGCSPKYTPEVEELGPNWVGGFYCPCHGSTFDFAGRVFKGVPAPINLEVPPYEFINETTIIIGQHSNKG